MAFAPRGSSPPSASASSNRRATVVFGDGVGGPTANITTNDMSASNSMKLLAPLLFENPQDRYRRRPSLVQRELWERRLEDQLDEIRAEDEMTGDGGGGLLESSPREGSAAAAVSDATNRRPLMIMLPSGAVTAIPARRPDTAGDEVGTEDWHSPLRRVETGDINSLQQHQQQQLRRYGSKGGSPMSMVSVPSAPLGFRSVRSPTSPPNGSGGGDNKERSGSSQSHVPPSPPRSGDASMTVSKDGINTSPNASTSPAFPPVSSLTSLPPTESREGGPRGNRGGGGGGGSSRNGKFMSSALSSRSTTGAAGGGTTSSSSLDADTVSSMIAALDALWNASLTKDDHHKSVAEHVSKLTHALQKQLRLQYDAMHRVQEMQLKQMVHEDEQQQSEERHRQYQAHQEEEKVRKIALKAGSRPVSKQQEHRDGEGGPTTPSSSMEVGRSRAGSNAGGSKPLNAVGPQASASGSTDNVLGRSSSVMTTSEGGGHRSSVKLSRSGSALDSSGRSNNRKNSSAMGNSGNSAKGSGIQRRGGAEKSAAPPPKVITDQELLKLVEEAERVLLADDPVAATPAGLHDVDRKEAGSASLPPSLNGTKSGIELPVMVSPVTSNPIAPTPTGSTSSSRQGGVLRLPGVPSTAVPASELQSPQSRRLIATAPTSTGMHSARAAFGAGPILPPPRVGMTLSQFLEPPLRPKPLGATGRVALAVPMMSRQEIRNVATSTTLPAAGTSTPVVNTATGAAVSAPQAPQTARIPSPPAVSVVVKAPTLPLPLPPPSSPRATLASSAGVGQADATKVSASSSPASTAAPSLAGTVAPDSLKIVLPAADLGPHAPMAQGNPSTAHPVPMSAVVPPTATAAPNQSVGMAGTGITATNVDGQVTAATTSKKGKKGGKGGHAQKKGDPSSLPAGIPPPAVTPPRLTLLPLPSNSLDQLLASVATIGAPTPPKMTPVSSKSAEGHDGASPSAATPGGLTPVPKTTHPPTMVSTASRTDPIALLPTAPTGHATSFTTPSRITPTAAVSAAATPSNAPLLLSSDRKSPPDQAGGGVTLQGIPRATSTDGVGPQQPSPRDARKMSPNQTTKESSTVMMGNADTVFTESFDSTLPPGADGGAGGSSTERPTGATPAIGGNQRASPSAALCATPATNSSAPVASTKPKNNVDVQRHVESACSLESLEAARRAMESSEAKEAEAESAVGKKPARPVIGIRPGAVVTKPPPVVPAKTQPVASGVAATVTTPGGDAKGTAASGPQGAAVTAATKKGSVSFAPTNGESTGKSGAVKAGAAASPSAVSASSKDKGGASNQRGAGAPSTSNAPPSTASTTTTISNKPGTAAAATPSSTPPQVSLSKESSAGTLEGGGNRPNIRIVARGLTATDEDPEGGGGGLTPSESMAGPTLQINRSPTGSGESGAAKELTLLETIAAATTLDQLPDAQHLHYHQHFVSNGPTVASTTSTSSAGGGGADGVGGDPDHPHLQDVRTTIQAMKAQQRKKVFAVPERLNEMKSLAVIQQNVDAGKEQMTAALEIAQKKLWDAALGVQTTGGVDGRRLSGMPTTPLGVDSTGGGGGAKNGGKKGKAAGAGGKKATGEKSGSAFTMTPPPEGLVGVGSGEGSKEGDATDASIASTLKQQKDATTALMGAATHHRSFARSNAPSGNFSSMASGPTLNTTEGTTSSGVFGSNTNNKPQVVILSQHPLIVEEMKLTERLATLLQAESDIHAQQLQRRKREADAFRQRLREQQLNIKNNISQTSSRLEEARKNRAECCQKYILWRRKKEYSDEGIADRFEDELKLEQHRDPKTVGIQTVVEMDLIPEQLERLIGLMQRETEVHSAIRGIFSCVRDILEVQRAVAIELTCPTCDTLMETAVTLWPCGHTFCKHCVQDTMVLPNDTQAHCCLTCGQVGSEGFAPNYLIRKLVSRWKLKSVESMDLLESLRQLDGLVAMFNRKEVERIIASLLDSVAI